MSNVLNHHIVLVINRGYQVLGVTTPRKAIVAMCSSSNGVDLAAKGMAIEYPKNEMGGYIFDDGPSNIIPMFWDEWQKQEIRNFDSFITTAKTRIRIPTVLLAYNCDKTVYRSLRPTKRNIYLKYGRKCAYTGQELSLSSMSVDHVIPKSRWKELGKSGSADSWENLVPCEKNLNHKKGNRLNSEIGLELLIKPSAPKNMPISQFIKEIRSKDWEIFLHK